MACFFFSDPWNPFLGFRFKKIDPEPITVLVIPLDIMLKLSVFCFLLFIRLFVLNVPTTAKVKLRRGHSDRLVKPEIKHATPGLQGEEYSVPLF